ncbi:MAG TPA: hypothetical protein VF054_10475 [Micromonosporaceae bacterium]
MRIRPAHLLAVGALVVALAGCGNSNSPSPSQGSGSPRAAGPTAAAPAPASTSWAVPADASAAAKAAGLPMLGEEKLTVHYHSHLDVLVDGQPVQVPAGIGIDEARQKISPLHTHDTTGVVHIESATDVPYTLGQFFTEWGQPLNAHQVGPVAVASGQTLRVYRNGQQVDGDPGALRLGAHDEIVVWVGPADQQPQVPTSYNFPAGE